MPPYALVDKAEGETPLAALERYRSRAGIPADVPLTYAGRLDPMASGTLLILIGEECRRRANYDGLDKEYEFDILCGFASDTGDILGLATACAPHADVYALRRAARECIGKMRLPYPAFSSKTVRGIPLFQWALEGRLGEIEIPTADVRVYDLRLSDTRTCGASQLYEDITRRLSSLRTDPSATRLGSDFRKRAVLARWRELLSDASTYTIARFRASVSAGTYVRSLAPILAERAGAGGLAYTIRRTRIGSYTPLPFGYGYWRGLGASYGTHTSVVA